MSSTVGSGYFGPYYPTTQYPCSTLVFSYNGPLVQLVLYTTSAAMVHRRHQLGPPISCIYRRPSAIQNRQSSHTGCPVQHFLNTKALLLHFIPTRSFHK